MIKIAIVDDHQIVIDGIRLMLGEESDLKCIATALNGKAALELLQTTKVDVLLLDINMPEMDGLECCKRVKSSFPEIKIIILSMLQEASLIKKMLKLGASGYLLKNAGKDEVVEAIRKVYAGEQFFGSEVMDIVMGSFSGKNKTAKKSPFPKISRREKQVLQLIVDERTTAEIAQELFISFGTVETHRRNLLMKLDARNTAGLVKAALEYELLK